MKFNPLDPLGLFQDHDGTKADEIRTFRRDFSNRGLEGVREIQTTFNPLDPLGVYRKHNGSQADDVIKTRYDVMGDINESAQDFSHVFWPPPDPMHLFHSRQHHSEIPRKELFEESGAPGPLVRKLWPGSPTGSGESLKSYHVKPYANQFTVTHNVDILLPWEKLYQTFGDQQFSKTSALAVIAKTLDINAAQAEIYFNDLLRYGIIEDPIPIEWANDVVPLKERVRAQLLAAGYSPAEVERGLKWGEEWLMGMARRVSPGSPDFQKQVVVAGYPQLTPLIERWLGGIESFAGVMERG